MKTIIALLFLLTSTALISQLSVSSTYSSGDIPTSFLSYDPACNGPTTTISITLPSGSGSYEVVGIDIDYEMTAAGVGWMADQRSQIFCQNTSILEPSVFVGVGNTSGTYVYNRANVDIANGDYNPSDIITFEMHAWRVFEPFGCNSTVNKVDDGTWTITMYYRRCPVAGITLLDNADVTSFITNYGTCQTLNGDLTISGYPYDCCPFSSSPCLCYVDCTIDDISGLNFLEHINGSLIINDSELPSLNGLQNMLDIGGDLIIGGGEKNLYGQFYTQSNPDLIDISQLSNLAVVPGELQLSHNYDLASLSGLENLISVGANVLVAQNDIASFSQLSGLTQIPESLILLNNVSLQDLSGFENLLSIGVNLDIKNNSSTLSNVTQLQNITSLPGYLGLSGLPSFVGLENITSVGTDLNISYNTVNDLTSLQNIQSVGNDFYIGGNSNLTDLDGFNFPTLINGELEISGNSSLQSLKGLEDVKIINGNLKIQSNPLLVNINDLNKLSYVENDIVILSNNSLSNCCVCLELFKTNLGGDFVGTNNMGCQSFIDINLKCAEDDSDSDLILAADDNCPDYYNPLQTDNDSDGIGNACDNCPLASNPGQVDSNNNFIGDVCETPETGKSGINTTNPKTGLEISASELYLSDTSRGLIMTSSSGDCYRIYIDADGNLQHRLITCPN